MNKQVLARLEEIRREFESRLDNVIAQLAEAEKLEKLDKLLEKPELRRHGDFGMNMLFPRIVINGTVYNASGECIRNVDDGAIGKHCSEIWFGNVFDLMKDWDKPFEDYEIKPIFGGREIRITKSSMKDIWICIIETTDSMKRKGAHLTLAESEKIHNALGHAIAELKRKQMNKEISGEKERKL